MFLDHFGFIEQPFGVTPDPRFLHFGRQHREALASLIYGTEMNRGFLALIAQPGMGKTSLLFQFLEGLRNKARTAFLFHNASDRRELMRYLLADIEVDASGKDLPEMHGMLDRVLTKEMQAGRRFVLVIDEAQNLSDDLLESVRLLSNFETPWKKLMQIVLSGQPQLGESLARPSMWQLRQRISSFIRLEPFKAEEMSTYIDHRLWVAGYEGPPLFTHSAKAIVVENSGGIPRNINTICFQSLSIACAMGKKQVESPMVREAIADLAIETPSTASANRLPASSAQIVCKSPFSLPRKATESAQTSDSPRSRWNVAAVVSSVAILFLGFVSGVLWKTAAPPSQIDATPSVEAAALPVRVALPRAPETIPTQATRRTSSLTVIVKQGVTLRHLCLLYLDRFDPATLAEIRALNPGIADSDHIEAGQPLRLPLAERREMDDRSRVATAGPTPREEAR